MSKLIQLLEEIKAAGKEASLPLDMQYWYDCGTSCCACGDVAIARGSENVRDDAEEFAWALNRACINIFGNAYFVRSIYSANKLNRHVRAKRTKLFTKEELTHPHLNSDHHDREILHSYIDLCIDKIKEHINS